MLPTRASSVKMTSPITVLFSWSHLTFSYFFLVNFFKFDFLDGRQSAWEKNNENSINRVHYVYRVKPSCITSLGPSSVFEPQGKFVVYHDYWGSAAPIRLPYVWFSSTLCLSIHFIRVIPRPRPGGLLSCRTSGMNRSRGQRITSSIS